jgi:hypothetical protein
VLNGEGKPPVALMAACVRLNDKFCAGANQTLSDGGSPKQALFFFSIKQTIKCVTNFD